MTTEKLSSISRQRVRESKVDRLKVKVYTSCLAAENTKKDAGIGRFLPVAYCGTLAAMTTGTVYAAGEYTATITEVLQKFIDIIGTVFQAVGVVLAIWGFVQLILAIRNDDPDSKTRASTQAIVGIVLLSLPTIIDTLGLVSYVGKDT